MNRKMTFFIFVIVAAMVAAALPAGAQRNYDRGTVYSAPDEDRGPSFSSPTVRELRNGDVPSHYPPYYHPQGDGQ